jgi:hypothetical protein
MTVDEIFVDMLGVDEKTFFVCFLSVCNDHFQGCQIFLGTGYQNRKKCTKSTQNVPNSHKISQLSLNIPNGHNIYQHLPGVPLWLNGKMVKNEKINEIERPQVRSPPYPGQPL